MLVLSRMKQQQLKIGDNVTVTVLQIRGKSVKLGVDAPADVRVLRAELEVDDEKAPQDRAPTGRRVLAARPVAV